MTEQHPAREQATPTWRRIFCAFAVLAAAALFGVERLMPEGIDLAALYLVIVVASATLLRRLDALVVAAACGFFALAGALVAPPPAGLDYRTHAANRLLIVAAIGIVAGIQRRHGRARGAIHREQTFRALLEAAPDAMVIADTAGRIVLVNSQAEALFGYDRTELLGQPVESLIPAALRDRHRGHRGAFAADPRPRTMGVGLELAALRRDGSSFPVEIALGPLETEQGTLVSAAIRDITERKRTERALRDFLATLGHELRNPMAAMRNATHVLRHPSVTPEQASWAQGVIEAEGRHMTRLIDDLLDLSRVARNSIELRRERVEFARIVDRVLASSVAVLEERRHQISVSLPREPIVLDADPVRLAQVFANLVDNAAKYSPPGARIAITGGREGDSLVVRVRDNGIGIAPDAQRRVFDMFYRVDHSLEQPEPGLGIGLTLVRQLVELHGGRVEVGSPGPGQGSEFTVRLPAAASAPEARPADGEETAAHATARRVLVADDNRRAADSLALLLRLDGHEVETAYDGRQAVTAAAAFGPQVALLDIGMPELNGYDAARRIRDLPAGSQIHLVALTGMGTPEDRERAREAGFDAHLVKPVDVEALGRLLANPPRQRADTVG